MPKSLPARCPYLLLNDMYLNYLSGEALGKSISYLIKIQYMLYIKIIWNYLTMKRPLFSHIDQGKVLRLKDSKER